MLNFVKSQSITSVVVLVFVAITTIYLSNNVSNFKNEKNNEKLLISGSNKISLSLVVATRIHKGNSTQLPSLKSIADFIRSINYAKLIIISIGIGDKLENIDYIHKLESYLQNEGLMPSSILTTSSTSLSTTRSILLLPVTPWGKFTMGLNAILLKCIEEKYDLIAFQSLEFSIPKTNVEKLIDIINDDKDILVIGPALPGHEFKMGSNKIEGRTCPWNTFAIWNVNYLGLTGFPMVGDGMGTDASGVEEVTTVNLLQFINNKLKVILVSMNGLEWKVDFQDEKRQAYHDEKMKSKNERPMQQMKWLGIQSGTVKHIFLQ